MRRYSVPRVGGGFPRRALFRVDADLVAPLAYLSPRVESFMEWVSRFWRPEGDILLLSPCSNVKPYPLSPLNRKVAKAVERAGGVGRVEWVFISDLLGPVPYNLTWVPPACCYEAPPHTMPTWWLRRVKEAVRSWWSRVAPHFTHVIAHLPMKYYPLAEPALQKATIIRYDIFHGQKAVEEALKHALQG